MNTESGERERSSERSDDSWRVSSHRFRNGRTSPTRDVVFEEYNDCACGACGRRFVPSKAVWETRLDAGAFSRERLVRVFHTAGAIHRPAPAGMAARGTGSGLPAGVQAGVGMLMSSPACGSSGRGGSVASSGPAARYGVRRGAGGRRRPSREAGRDVSTLGAGDELPAPN